VLADLAWELPYVAAILLLGIVLAFVVNKTKKSPTSA
jgi:hypothetical protein